MKPDRLEELLLDHEEDALSPEAKVELVRLLEGSAEARERLVERGLLAAMATERLDVEPDAAVPRRSTFRSWVQLRPMVSAAAGVLIGVFCTSIVMGYGNGLSRVFLPLANPGFERPEVLPQVNLVPMAGQWSGLDTEIVEAGGELPFARTGERMLRLGPAPQGKGYFASLMADLDQTRPVGNRPLQIEVTARFHASQAGLAEHYLLGASSFIEAPEAVPELWEESIRDIRTSALTSAHRSIFPTADESGWQTITVHLEVPPQARTLVVTLGSNTPGPAEGRTDHFMDDVEASWLILDESFPTITP